MAERVMVDMSATLIHQGHVRLLKKAAEYGEVVVALTCDEGVEKFKGYRPELPFAARREILEAMRYVAEVVPCDWLIDEAFLDRHRCSRLVHGEDNANPIPENRLLILPRTSGVSSTELRLRAMESIISQVRRREEKGE